MYHAYPGQSVVTAQIGRKAHPDVLANTIAQHIVGTFLFYDRGSRIDLNVALGPRAILGGQAKSACWPDPLELVDVVDRCVKGVGYSGRWGYTPERSDIIIGIVEQSPNIASIVGNGGAGDTITKIGFASDENPEYLPTSHILVRRVAAAVDKAFSEGKIEGLGPDGKINLALVYENGKPIYVSDVVVQAQHTGAVNIDKFREDIAGLVTGELNGFYDPQRTMIEVNGGGLFVYGGPLIDNGIKGKKDADHTYGNYIGHTGGSAFGKDPSKVDFHGLVTSRLIAKHIVAQGLAKVAKVHLTYSMGNEEPIIISINTYGTSDLSEQEIESIVRRNIPLRPKEVIKALGLREDSSFFPQTAEYFFKPNPFPWERILFPLK